MRVRNLNKLIIFLGILTLLFSCGSKQIAADGSDYAKEFKGAPNWVKAPDLEGGIATAASAPIGPLGIQFAKEEAVAKARDEIARMMETRVKNLVKNFERQTGVGDDTTAEKVVDRVSKQMAKFPLQGSKMKDSWISPNDNFWVLVIVDSSIAQEYAKKTIQTSYKNEKALWQQFQAKKAQEDLDKEIDKEFGEFNDSKSQ